MAIGRWVGALLVGAVALTGCPLDDIRANPWELGMITPDDQGLLVWFGTASGLESFTVTEDADAVTIGVRVRTRMAPGGADFPFDSRFVELEEPLGDRELLGCGRDDCRKFIFDLGGGGGPIIIAPDTVATGYPDTTQHHFDRTTGTLLEDAEPIDVPVWSRVHGATYPAGLPDFQVRIERLGLYVENGGGEPVWSTSLLPDYDTAPVVSGDLVVVAAAGPDDRGSRIIAFDVRTAEVRWEHEPFAGTLAATAAGLLVTLAVPEGDIRGTELIGLDVGTGEERWRTDLRAAVGDVHATETELFVSIHDGLVSLDPATGDIVWWSQVDAGLWTPPN